MKNRVRAVIVVRVMTLMLLLMLVLAAGVSAADMDPPGFVPQGGPSLTESFTYQGYVEDGGQPANGSYDFRFYIWDDRTSGNLISTCQAWDDQWVEDGLFAFHLIPADPMHEVFDGGRRWIEVRMRLHGTAPWTVLPRQPITAVPYAWSLKPGAEITGTIANRATLYVGNGYDAGTIGSAIYAENHADTSPTIYGLHHGTGHALYGRSESGYPTIEGRNDDIGTGVIGYSDAGTGVKGSTGSVDDVGVIGLQSGHGSADYPGYWAPGGFFAGRNGLIAVTEEAGGYAAYAWNKSTSSAVSYGVYARTQSPTAWAGYFRSEGHGVYANVGAGKTGFDTNGTKSAVVAASDGPRLLYTEESTQVWFTDYGFGELSGGAATVTIDPTFASTVNLDRPYHVFIQPYGPASLYVTDRTSAGFEVRAREGEPDCEFSYRIVAARRGYEDQRLEAAPWAEDDPNLYPQQAGSGVDSQTQGVEP
jgi:hypothetical protein